MTRPRIEPRSPRPLANSLPTRPMSRLGRYYIVSRNSSKDCVFACKKNYRKHQDKTVCETIKYKWIIFQNSMRERKRERERERERKRERERERERENQLQMLIWLLQTIQAKLYKWVRVSSAVPFIRPCATSKQKLSKLLYWPLNFYTIEDRGKMRPQNPQSL